MQKPSPSLPDLSLLARKEWSSPVMRAPWAGGVLVLWAFALLWFLPCVVGTLVLIARHQNVVPALLFDAIGLVLVSRAASQTAAQRKFGDITLTLDPYPGSIAGHVGGVIDGPAALSGVQAFALELVCARVHYTHGAASSRLQMRDSAVWEDVASFRARLRSDGRVEIPFCFEVPAGLPYSSAPTRDYQRWTLRVSGKLDDADFARQWTIPVLSRGGQASAAISLARAVTPVTAETDAQLHLQHGASAVTLDFPAGRSSYVANYLLVVGAVFCGAAWLLGRGHALGMLLISGIIGVLTLAGGVWLRGNRLLVQVRGRVLSIKRTLFGIPVWNRELPLASIAGITCERGNLKLEDRGSVKVYYHVLVKTLQGETYIVGDGFVGQSAAQAGADRLAALARLKVL